VKQRQRGYQTVDTRKLLLSVGIVGLSAVSFSTTANADSQHRPEGRGREVKVKPGQSIQAAINAAKPSTTIKITAGIYKEQLVISKDGIRLIGEGATLAAPAAFTANACTAVTKLGPPLVTSPDADAGICIIGDVTFNAYDEFFGNKTVNTVSRSVTGVSVSGLHISGFGVAILMAGAERTRIAKNTIDGSDSFATLALNSPNTTEEYNTATNGPATVAGIGMCAQHSPGLVWHENDLSGFITGLCISTSNATVIENQVHDNHFGIQVDPGENHITIRGNHVYDNRRADPFPIGVPTGVGILIAGHDVLVEDNTVTGNYADNVAIVGQPFGGGILVVDSPGPPGHESTVSNVVVRDNHLSNNGDVVLTGVDLALFSPSGGTGNVFTHNDCTSSLPAGLCAA
jgi:nitrous oxidase accessory protein NosD